MDQRQDNRIFSWSIDREDNIVQVNEAWLAFARENSAPQLSREAVINQPLWSFITGPEVNHLYELIIDKVRYQKSSLSFPFRCDSPDCRRYLEMQVFPLPEEAVQFQSRVIKLEFREPVNLLESGERSGQWLRICSWCKRIFAGGQWLEVEAAIKLLNLFAEEALPQLTHGICESCHELAIKALTPTKNIPTT